MLRLTILAENKVRKSNLLAEHGLSIWIELDGRYFLFDTGQTDIFLTNAYKLGIDVTCAQAIVLSHGHYDHGGGLIYFPTQKKIKLVAHPSAFKRKVSYQDDGQMVYAGLPENMPQWPDLQLNSSIYQLDDNVYAVTGIETETGYKKSADKMFIQENGQIYPDSMIDEQLMVIKRDYGLVVILGCSHPGVVNCLLHVKNKFPGQKIAVIIGGMHLGSKDDNELEQIIDIFREMDVSRLLPLHCTGLDASCRMKQVLGDKVFLPQTGDQIELE